MLFLLAVSPRVAWRATGRVLENMGREASQPCKQECSRHCQASEPLLTEQYWTLPGDGATAARMDLTHPILVRIQVSDPWTVGVVWHARPVVSREVVGSNPTRSAKLRVIRVEAQRAAPAVGEGEDTANADHPKKRPWCQREHESLPSLGCRFESGRTLQHFLIANWHRPARMFLKLKPSRARQ